LQAGHDTTAAEPEFWTGRRVWTAVAAGVGVLGLGVGSVFALVANSTYHDSLDECPKDKNRCTSVGVRLRDDARTQGDLATVGFVIGGLGLATAGVLLLWPSKSETRSASVEVHPTLGGMSVGGRW